MLHDKEKITPNTLERSQEEPDPVIFSLQNMPQLRMFACYRRIFCMRNPQTQKGLKPILPDFFPKTLGGAILL